MKTKILIIVAGIGVAIGAAAIASMIVSNQELLVSEPTVLPSPTLITGDLPLSGDMPAPVATSVSISEREFKTCSSGKTWQCKMVTQGVANPPLVVCGCASVCSGGNVLVTSMAQGTWPDGSKKGSFSCSSPSFLPPSLPQ